MQGQRVEVTRPQIAMPRVPAPRVGAPTKPASPPSKRLDEKQRRRSKTFSILDGSMYSVSAGLTGSFIGAFAVALGAPNSLIAMISTLPNLIAAVFQLGVQQVRRVFKSRKAFLVFFSALQALTWLPLIFVPQLQHPGWWLLLFVTLSAIFGMMIGPVWNSFMSDIVEEDERGRFFGRRNMFTGFSAFIATIVAGWVLSTMTPINLFVGFGILFGLACVFRLMSAYFLSKMDDPPEDGVDTASPDLLSFARNARETHLGRFTIFVMLFNVAVFVAAPFFTVYELHILKFDYFTFTMIACASAISSFITMIYWGKYVDTIGSKNVMVVCGFLIPFVPFLWALTIDPWMLLLVEVFSGIVWAGFNLSVSTYIFDATDRKNRTSQIAAYTLLVQLAVFVGAIAGSGLISMLDKDSATTFHAIFFLSAALRLLVVLLFFNMLKELRIIEVPIKGRLFRKFISIRPQHGVVYETVMENPSDTHLRSLRAREIKEDLEEYARKARSLPKGNAPKGPSSIKELEKSEDEQDTADYLRRLRK